MINIDRIKLSYRIQNRHDLIIFKCYFFSKKIRNAKTSSSCLKYLYMGNNYTLEYVPIIKTVFITFNFRTILHGVNIGRYDKKDVNKILSLLIEDLKSNFNIEFSDLHFWKIARIEISQDFNCGSTYAKSLILNAFLKANTGHKKLLSFDTLYACNHSGAAKIYDKKAELTVHKKIFNCNDGNIDNMIRFEFEINHRKLCKIMSKILNCKKTQILLNDILNINIIYQIHHYLKAEMKLTGKMTTLKNALEIISKKILNKKLKISVSNFILFVNQNSACEAKAKYGSNFYRYIKIISNLGLCYLCIDSEENITLDLDESFKDSAIFNSFYIDQVFTTKSSIKIISFYFYNIYTLFIISTMNLYQNLYVKT